MSANIKIINLDLVNRNYIVNNTLDTDELILSSESLNIEELGFHLIAV